MLALFTVARPSSPTFAPVLCSVHVGGQQGAWALPEELQEVPRACSLDDSCFHGLQMVSAAFLQHSIASWGPASCHMRQQRYLNLQPASAACGCTSHAGSCSGCRNRVSNHSPRIHPSNTYSDTAVTAWYWKYCSLHCTCLLCCKAVGSICTTVLTPQLYVASSLLMAGAVWMRQYRFEIILLPPLRPCCRCNRCAANACSVGSS